MTGMQMMEAFVSRQLEPPPIAKLLGFQFDEIQKGRTVMRMQADRQHANPMGTLHGGILCDLGDAAMGCAVASLLDDGESFTTIELKINFFKPIFDDELTAVGAVVRRTKSLAYAECDITDSSGSLVAKLASTCMMLRGQAANGR